MIKKIDKNAIAKDVTSAFAIKSAERLSARE